MRRWQHADSMECQNNGNLLHALIFSNPEPKHFTELLGKITHLDPEQVSYNAKWTPFHVACQFASVEICQLLLEHFPEIDLHKKDLWGTEASTLVLLRHPEDDDNDMFQLVYGKILDEKLAQVVGLTLLIKTGFLRTTIHDHENNNKVQYWKIMSRLPLELIMIMTRISMAHMVIFERKFVSERDIEGVIKRFVIHERQKKAKQQSNTCYMQ